MPARRAVTRRVPTMTHRSESGPRTVRGAHRRPSSATSLGSVDMRLPGRYDGVARPIVTYGSDPVLHRACAPVTEFDGPLRRLLLDMFASMEAADGVGLAANQIGVDARIFVIDCPDAE